MRRWSRCAFGLCIQIIAIPLCVSSVRALTAEEMANIEVYKKASPGVVHIRSTVVRYGFFFQPVPSQGTGSGVILDREGNIVTNAHVVQEARSLEVTLFDGSVFPAELVSSLKELDLAVIRIKAPPEKLKPIPLGDSKALEVGQAVYAIGNPFGFQQTLTKGVISSLDRTLLTPEGRKLKGLVQTDAAINPGNSGGPLLDSEGRIIGINTAIFSPSGGSVGIGFAIPVDTAKRILPDLVEKGYVAHAWMGVSLFPLTSGLAKALDLPVSKGALVVEVMKGGPADKAGLRGGTKMVQLGNAILPVGGDVITAMDGEAVNSSEELVRKIRKHRPGEQVRLRIVREKKTLEVTLSLGERPRGK